MGIQDRDYYWEDRKRREEKFSKKDVWYRPKQFRRKRTTEVSGSSPDDWTKEQRAAFRRQVYARPERRGLVKGMAIGTLIGGVMTFVVMLVILHLDAELVGIPYRAVGTALETLGML